MPPLCVKPDRERLRTDLTLFFLRAVRVRSASPLMPLGVMIASKGFIAVAAKMLLLRLGLLLLDTSGLRASDFPPSDLDGDLKVLLIGGRGSGAAFA